MPLTAELESHGSGFQNDIQHRIAELLPAGGAPIAQLICHPVLVAVLRQYLGDKFRCATFSSNTLLPQGALCCTCLHAAHIASMLKYGDKMHCNVLKLKQMCLLQSASCKIRLPSHYSQRPCIGVYKAGLSVSGTTIRFGCRWQLRDRTWMAP